MREFPDYPFSVQKANGFHPVFLRKADSNQTALPARFSKRMQTSWKAAPGTSMDAVKMTEAIAFDLDISIMEQKL
ncbi:conserved domain protein [delta proteobacterium NaphS2]|nr:conserved domain protein [delta proteobacterium NaphS2]